MKRKDARISISTITSLAMVVAIAVSGLLIAPTPTALATGSFSYDFESTLSPWVGNADPEVLGFALTRQTGANACPSNGSWHADLQILSSPRSRSAVWMETSYADSGALTVNLSWKARNGGACTGNFGSCETLAYIGTTAPASGADFDNVETVLNTWETSSYSRSLTASGTVYVAIGWRFPLGGLLAIDPLRDPLDPGQGRVQHDCVNVTIQSNSQPPP